MKKVLILVFGFLVLSGCAYKFCEDRYNLPKLFQFKHEKPLETENEEPEMGRFPFWRYEKSHA